MLRQFFILILTLLIGPLALAQEGGAPVGLARETPNLPLSLPPFTLIEEEAKERPGGWAGNKERLASFFNAERDGLGDRFEPELMKFLGSDPEKHYWISSFLEASGYPFVNNKPLPHLSLLLKQQGLSLLQGRTDQEGRSLAVSLNAAAAVLARRLNLEPLAVGYKKQAEELVAKDAALKSRLDGMSAEEKTVYSSIGDGGGETEQAPRPAAGTAQRRKRPGIVSAAALDGRATYKPAATYPRDAAARKVEGRVTVRVTVSEEGVVESATAESGHPLLVGAAVEAARRARFAPIRLGDWGPVKFYGTLTYEFKKEEQR